MVRGQGIYLFDAEGRRYVDAVSSWWACNLGHSHPRLIRALELQSHQLQHCILGNQSHPGAIELAERLSALIGGAEPMYSLFSGDGSSSIEAALKMAVQYHANRGHPERHRLVALKNAYHGDTLGAISVGDIATYHQPYQSLLFDAIRAESPCCRICPWNRNPDTCALDCFESLRGIVKRQASELAAVIVEPLCQGSAGMRIYSPRYLAALAALCRKQGVLLILDEIAVGFGRTGRWFAFQHAGVDPDIVCVGKALAGGYLPMSAVVARRSIYETFTDAPVDHTFYHGHTFGGNPLAAALALETLKIYEEEGIVEHVRRKGECLAGWGSRMEARMGVRAVRCLGLIAALEFEDGQGQGTRRAQQVRQELLRQGILVRPLGPVVYLLPPLIVTDGELRNLLDAFDLAVTVTAPKFARQRGRGSPLGLSEPRRDGSAGGVAPPSKPRVMLD